VELRTFVVEDNATIRENLIGTLEELACIRALAGPTPSGRPAWLARPETDWDLAIVDLFLKQGSGLGVLEACRTRGRSSGWWCCRTTRPTEMRKRCSQLGADAVFDKSNEIDALIDYCMQQSEASRA
jgi:two-component system OmpR family response regulator